MQWYIPSLNISYTFVSSSNLPVNFTMVTICTIFYSQGPSGPQGPIGYPGPRGVKVRFQFDDLIGQPYLLYVLNSTVFC